MSQNYTPEDVEKIIADLNGLVPDESLKILRDVKRQSELNRHLADVTMKELEDLKAALVMYERECGESSIMFQDHMRICREQVAMGRR